MNLHDAVIFSGKYIGQDPRLNGKTVYILYENRETNNFTGFIEINKDTTIVGNISKEEFQRIP